MAPKIDRTNLNPITVKSGLGVALDVHVDGEPVPTIEWFFKDKPVLADDNVNINNSDYNTNFVIIRASRPQSGTYTIVAKNMAGEDRADVEITVLAKPGTPEGPLVISDVSKHGCHLKWKKPEDDGGMPIDHYEIEKLDPFTGTWIPCATSEEPEAEIVGLQEGKSYKFRVKAVNKEGESEPLVNEHAIIAKDPFSVPDKPEPPIPVDWDKNFVELEWKRPEDNGAPIDKYILQMRDKSGRNWVDAGTVPGDRTKGRVEPLEPGHEYEFRVKAVNKAGPSDPSDSSRAIIAKPRFLAPKIDRKNMEKKVIRTHQFIRVEIDVAGEPAPQLTWTRDGKPISEFPNVKVDFEPYKTTFLLQKAVRADKGAYKLTAKNDSGTDEADLEIEVLSSPSKPKGPLKVSDVTAEGCKLKWEAPEDDGGEPIDHYVVERMDVETGRWVPVTTSKTPEADVTGLTEGKEYKFRVKAVNKEGESTPLETDGTVKAKNPFDAADAPGQPQVTDYCKDSANIKWKAPESDGGSPVMKYLIEKKDPVSGKWVKAMETAGPVCEAKVPGLIEGKPYQFQVKAINKAGPSKPSMPSETIIAKDRFVAPRIDRTNIRDIIVKAGQHVRLEVKVSGEPPAKKQWKLNDKPVQEDESITATYEDYRTKLYIPVCKRGHTGPLTIYAENASGKDEAKLQLTVLDVPSAPEGPLAVSDVHKEGCTLNWKPPADDGGEPIEYYAIEKMDEDTGRWVPCGKANNCKAVIGNLEPGHKYKFRVAAVNREGESTPLETEHSIVAKNPFDEPGKPGTPEVTDWDADRVDLKWTPPLNDGGAPITAYVIEKRPEGGKWTRAAEVPGDANTASVPNLDENTNYEFRVRAVNEAGPGEPSDASRSVMTKPRKRKYTSRPASYYAILIEFNSLLI